MVKKAENTGTKTKVQDDGRNFSSYEEYYNENVPVMLLHDNAKYKDDVTVTVNGVNYQLKRGVSLLVPRKVALVLERARNQEADARAYMDSLKS